MQQSKTLLCIMKKLKKTGKTTKVFHHTVKFLSFLAYWIQWTAYTLSGFFEVLLSHTSATYVCLNKKT